MPASPLVQLTFKGGFHLQEAPNGQDLFYARIDTAGIWSISENGKEELFIPHLNSMDWGAWLPVEDGLLYLDRNSGNQLLHQSNDIRQAPTTLITFSKRIQYSTPLITANKKGDRVIIAQIERSEDEIMMVELNQE